MQRIIMEGMDPDKTRVGYVAGTMDVPDAVAAICYWGNTLHLQGTIGNNTLQPTSTDGSSEIYNVSTVELPYGVGFTSVQTLFTEDGRVFSCANEDRFQQALEDICGSGLGFNRAYERIRADVEGSYFGRSFVG